jgi:hypothetical protein
MADVAGREATIPRLGLKAYSNSSAGFNAASVSAVALFALIVTINSSFRPSDLIRVGTSEVFIRHVLPQIHQRHRQPSGRCCLLRQ